MEYVGNGEIVRTIHAREVGNPRDEGRCHAQGLEEVHQVCPCLDPETGKVKGDQLAGHPGHESTGCRCIQRCFNLAELTGIGYYHH